MESQRINYKGLERLGFLSDKAARFVSEMQCEADEVVRLRLELVKVKAECADAYAAIEEMQNSLRQMERDDQEMNNRIERIMGALKILDGDASAVSKSNLPNEKHQTSFSEDQI